MIVKGGVFGLTPFDASVSEIEPPGPVTEMLIEAGAEPEKRKLGRSYHWMIQMSEAGTHWAVASYMERHGKSDIAIQHYELAAQWYESASKKALGHAKWMNFMSSPVMRSVVVVGALATESAARSQGKIIIWGDPSPYAVVP